MVFCIADVRASICLPSQTAEGAAAREWGGHAEGLTENVPFALAPACLRPYNKTIRINLICGLLRRSRKSFPEAPAQAAWVCTSKTGENVRGERRDRAGAILHAIQHSFLRCA